MSSIEDNQNIVELFKQALKFYGEKSNYDAKHPINNVLFSQIEMDCGAQARFALEKAEELENLSKTMEDEFVKSVTSAIEKGNDADKIMGIMEEIIKKQKDRLF